MILQEIVQDCQEFSLAYLTKDGLRRDRAALGQSRWLVRAPIPFLRTYLAGHVSIRWTGVGDSGVCDPTKLSQES